MDNNIIFEIIKASIWNSPLQCIENADCQSIYEELRSQTILALPGGIINDTLVSDADVLKNWLTDIAMQMTHFHQILYYQTELLNMLFSNNFHPVILKGSAAAMYYPCPEYRVMGDIDFYVPSQEFDDCFKLMLSNGYTLGDKEDLRSYHITLLKSGVHFELHNKPPGIEENERGGYLLDVLNSAFDSIETKSIVGNEFPVFPALQNGIVLLLHIEKHLKEGLGLRQIIDWMMFVDRCLDDKVWENEFKPVLHKGRLDTLAVTVTKMCTMYLGLCADNFKWCLDADDELCESLMQYILEQGNFGFKKRDAQYGAAVLSRTGSLWEFIKNLQKNGEMNWKALNKHKFLRPFAWAYQILRYLRCAFSRNNPVITLINDFRIAKKRQKMLNKLGVYQKNVQ